MTRALNAGRVTFAALAVPNYRLYYGGQAISLIGTWMQMTAQSWLVLTLTHSGAALGGVVALQTIPVLLLAPYGGVIADRVDKRRLMVALQSAMGVQALVLGLLTVTGAVQVWEIGALAFVLGLNNAFENPARQSFMMEMVGPEHLRNAVSLNSVLVNVARTIGPAVAGVLIATVGDGVCFLVNAASFVAVVTTLVIMDRSQLRPSTPAVRAPGQLREGLEYVRGNRDLWIPLAMMAAVGCLTYEFQVSLPVMAKHGLNAGATGFGFMTAAMGFGAVCGGLMMAARGKTGLRPLVFAAFAFGVAMTFATAAPTLAVELVALAFVGAASITFMSTGNSTLQLTAEPSMRGRVMSLWFVAFQGSTPIGGPVVGVVMGLLGARAGLGLGAITCIVVAAVGATALARRRRAPAGMQGGSVQLQDATDRVQSIDQPVHVRERVVHRERRPRRRRYAELAHQRLRAVMAGADADAIATEDLTDVVRMGALEREGDERPAIRGSERAVHEQSRDL
jgi:MFS family permease